MSRFKSGRGHQLYHNACFGQFPPIRDASISNRKANVDPGRPESQTPTPPVRPSAKRSPQCVAASSFNASRRAAESYSMDGGSLSAYGSITSRPQVTEQPKDSRAAATRVAVLNSRKLYSGCRCKSRASRRGRKDFPMRPKFARRWTRADRSDAPGETKPNSYTRRRYHWQE